MYLYRLGALLSAGGFAWAQSLSPSDITTVTNNLATGATHSWELGTRTQAILDLDAPEFSVFASQVPPPQTVPSNTTSAISPVFSIAHDVVSALKNTSGAAPLMADGAAGDPASIGVAVLLANWTNQGGGLNYAAAATNQLDFLLSHVPRTGDGAISHRVAQVQLWSDFVFMVPPFLAFYGVTTGNSTLISQAYTQIQLYRKYLRDTSANNLWKHIVLGTDPSDVPNDDGHWSTGNGWAAAGMLRVLATMKNSQFSGSFKNEQKDLASWVKEIHSAMYANVDSTNIFTNYADRPVSASGSFYDTASTALLASTVYRFALLWGDHTHIPNAEKGRQALFASGSPGSAFVIPTTSTSSSPSASSIPSASSLSASSVFSASSLSASSSSVSPSSQQARSATIARRASSVSSQPSNSSSTRSGSASGSASATAPATSPSATTAPIASLVHFTDDGWLTPVVNPNAFGIEGSHSPEGQAFVLELQASYNEWVATGSPGINIATRSSAPVGWLIACAMLGSLLAYS